MVRSAKMVSGGMAEWLKAAVLKTVSGVTRSGVRIPLPPPEKKRVSCRPVGPGKMPFQPPVQIWCKSHFFAFLNSVEFPTASSSPL